MKDGVFEIEITKEGSLRAYPAIWYAGMAGRKFWVIKSKAWKVYEVVKGRYKGKVVDPCDATVYNFKYCQREIEDESRCREQCSHCKKYFAPLEKLNS